MTMTFSIIFLIAAILLMSFTLLALMRIFLGPTAPDRVVGVDTVNTLVIANMIVLGAAHDHAIYIELAIVYALLSFIGTIFIARYIEGGL